MIITMMITIIIIIMMIIPTDYHVVLAVIIRYT